MLNEEEKKWYVKHIKIYKLLSKCCILLLFIPIGFLVYEVYIRPTNEADISVIVTSLIFFVVIYVAYMSFNIKKEIIKDILEASEKKSESKKAG